MTQLPAQLRDRTAEIGSEIAERFDRYMPRVTDDTRDRALPLALGAALVAIGIAIWRAKPSMLQIPDATPIDDRSNRGGYLTRAARKSRDGLKPITPDNLSGSIGRSLVFAGGAILVTRLLDELSSSGR